MRPRQQQWRVAVAIMLGSAATFGQVIGSVNSHPAAADPAPAPAATPNAAPAPPAPPAAPMARPAPPPPPAPQIMASPPAVKHGPAPPGVVAVVNGQTITTKQLADETVRVYGAQVLNNLIVETLVEQEAKKQHAEATDAQVNAEIEDRRNQIKMQMPGRTLEDLLAQNHLTLDDFKKTVKLTIEAGNLVAKQETPATLVHVKHLLVATTAIGQGPGAKPAHTDAEALAIIAKAQADLKAGKNWDDVVKTYSEDPSNKDKGGDLGILSPSSPMDPAFLKAAMALKSGETTDTPVKSMYGYHLIMAVSTSVNPPTAEQAAYAQAEKAYQQQQLHQLIPPYVQQLQAKSNVINYLAP